MHKDVIGNIPKALALHAATLDAASRHLTRSTLELDAAMIEFKLAFSALPLTQCDPNFSIIPGLLAAADARQSACDQLWDVVASHKEQT